MEETKCGQCGEVITGSSIGHEDWVQCFDCYCEEYEHIYNNHEEESYADFYCRTSCSCCAGDHTEEWYDDEEE